MTLQLGNDVNFLAIYLGNKVVADTKEALDIWNRLVPVIQELLKDRVEDIKDILSRYSPVEEAQMSLF